MSACGETADRCACAIEPADHSGPHECECGGSWTGTLWGSGFRMVTPPHIPAQGFVIIDQRHSVWRLEIERDQMRWLRRHSKCQRVK